MGAFYLRVEADPCQFILYDRNGDGVITIEELEEVFPDRNLADGLFERLDIEGKYIIEPRHEKTNILHMRKQRCRSASR